MDVCTYTYVYLYRDLVSRSTSAVGVYHQTDKRDLPTIICVPLLCIGLQLARHPLFHTLTPKTNKNNITGHVADAPLPRPPHLLHNLCRKTTARTHNNSNYPLYRILLYYIGCMICVLYVCVYYTHTYIFI